MAIPTSEIPTEAWLTATLRAAGVLTTSSVVSVRTEPLADEKGMTGPLLRLSLSYDHPEAGAPRSLVLKSSSPDPVARATISSMGFYEREVRFSQQLATRSPVTTPRCYDSDINLGSGRSRILLQDLSAARNGDAIAGCSLEEAGLVVRDLARLHATWWEDPELETKSWLSLRGFVSVAQVQAVFDEYWHPFLRKLSTPPDHEVVQAGAWLHEFLEPVSRRLLDQPPRTLIRHDCNADNLFFTSDGDTLSLVVIDWQLSTRGRGVMDVAWFLGGNIDSDLRRRHEVALLQEYHFLLMEQGVSGYSFERCFDDYRLAMLLPLARIASAVGMQAHLDATSGGFWNVTVPRYRRAMSELDVGELLGAHSAG